ncbi:meiotic chromosome segregation protein [Pterulicium gracile]|uniref:Meiotic chromosome segregation protein n=1 Tax=Pterulicium gracile TaxID=1884261 RepID=A0A5C3QL62_9AGAR|nr:meiotic chromosome segregation protein [Pterula gracilis]
MTTNPPPPSDACPEARKAYVDANPPPPSVPAYLSTTEGSPPLHVDRALYDDIQRAPRTLVQNFDLPIRSGRAWKVPKGHILRISTPDGPQVADLNIWSLPNPRERFWASRTRQLHASHLSTYDRLWSNLPYMRPLLTIIADSLSWYGKDATGGRCHDLLGTRCDPYVNVMLSGQEGSYDYHCHSNLVRAVLPWGLTEVDVHDVINLFQVTGLDEEGRYFMQPSPAQKGEYIEFLAETDLLCAMSTCPGGDLSVWGFGQDAAMKEVCRELRVEVFEVEGGINTVSQGRWNESEVSKYKGRHGMSIPAGEDGGNIVRD